MLFDNRTTIENLEMVKTKSKGTIYNIGPKHNFYQVFGSNPFLWPFPVFLNSGKPLGDGVNWANNLAPKKRESAPLNPEDETADQEKLITPEKETDKEEGKSAVRSPMKSTVTSDQGIPTLVHGNSIPRI